MLDRQELLTVLLADGVLLPLLALDYGIERSSHAGSLIDSQDCITLPTLSEAMSTLYKYQFSVGPQVQ